MEPTIGWTLLSQEALERASTYLNPHEKGVRDEIGFLSLHQGYADRFFPGTTVLQTRLRYVFFVPWIYRSIAENRGSIPIHQRVEAAELELAKCLNMSGEEGVIGGRSYPNPTSQPACMVYWTALQRWGILRSLPDGRYPDRATIHRTIAHAHLVSELTESNERIEYPIPLFINVPPRLDNWEKADEPIDFYLRPKEADFIRRQLISIPRSNTDNKPSFLAQIVTSGISIESYERCWHPSLMSIIEGSGDRQSLVNAGHAASLAAIGRAIYAALVESLRNDDNLPTESLHRPHCEDVIHAHQATASRTDLVALAQDLPNLQVDFLDLLSNTQRWLSLSTKHIYDLRDQYAAIETRRKGMRARLPRTMAASNKRAEWHRDDLSRAGPLHYRWNVVKRLVRDLEATNVS